MPSGLVNLVVVLQLLLATGGLCTTQKPSDRETKLLDSDTDLFRKTWVIVGVVTTSSLAVLIILIPTLLYYKYFNTRNYQDDVIKK